MSIIKQKITFKQEHFSDDVVTSIASYVSSNTQPWNRFPSLYKDKLVHLNPDQELTLNTKGQVSHQDVVKQSNESWLGKHKYLSDQRSMSTCGSVGITAKCSNNHSSALQMNCGKPFCSTCSMKGSYIHSRKIHRLEHRLIGLVKKGLVSTYNVTTMSKGLQHWVQFGNTDTKVQKTRLKDFRSIVNKTIVRFYKTYKGEDKIQDASVSAFHWCGSEWISKDQYIKVKNRQIEADAYFCDSTKENKFTEKDLNQLIKNRSIEYITQEFETKGGDTKEIIKVLSPSASEFHLHLNSFFLHKSEGEAYIPKEQLPALRQMLKDEVQIYLESQHAKGHHVPKGLLRGRFNLNSHLEYFNQSRITELKHRISYSLRETIGDSRFNRFTDAKKHYVLKVLKGFHNVVYYGQISTRNVNRYFDEMNIDPPEVEPRCCSVCDQLLQVNMIYNDNKKRNYPERTGKGITIEKELLVVSESGNSMKRTVTVSEADDPTLIFDEEKYPLTEHLKAILGENKEVVGYKYTQTPWRLHSDHLLEKCIYDFNKLVHIGVLKNDRQWLLEVVDYHIDLIKETTAIISSSEQRKYDERLVA